MDLDRLWISTIGPSRNSDLTPMNVHPWLGFRIGLIGNPGRQASVPGARVSRRE
ncbi:hypothetical protein OG373_37735 [Streptomyces avidinii]|uniref:hypothetical protein n=1 Tax=Streptomyces avidinii TaxID=1895 RepID=UPI00386FF0A5|nr:hypothetical protein OG373_37735 [Streptomyces avidinii]